MSKFLSLLQMPTLRRSCPGKRGGRAPTKAMGVQDYSSTRSQKSKNFVNGLHCIGRAVADEGLQVVRDERLESVAKDGPAQSVDASVQSALDDAEAHWDND